MKSQPIDISKLNKADVLAALYNASRPLGMGFMQFDPKPMMRDEADTILKSGTSFDYLKGRVMKVQIGGDELDPWGYDRDNGDGAAARAIAALQLGGTNAPSIENAHQAGKRQAAASAREQLSKESVFTGGDVPTVHLGLADVAHVLGPKINEAIEHENQ